ncbi:MAG: hypothetical protein ACLFTT_16645 [Candidatus Hydrogenedentota bacterium]
MNESAPDAPRFPVTFAAVAALVFLMLAPVFWRYAEEPATPHGPAVTNAPLYSYTLPVYDYGYTRLNQGALPAWCPDQYGGAPFYAGPGRALAQPLNVVFLLLPACVAMAWHGALALAVAGLGFVFFARTLELRRTATLYGGVVWAFGGVAAGAMSRPELAALATWTPWLLGCTGYYLREPRAARLLGIAGMVAAILLSGAYIAGGILLALAAAYGVVGLVLTPGSTHRTAAFAGLFATAAVAAGLTAVVWAPAFATGAAPNLPTLAVLRPAGFVDAFQQLSGGPRADLPYAGYYGLAAFLLWPAAFARRRQLAASFFFAVAALVLTGAALWMESGDGALLGAGFCVAVLATLGADAFLAPARDLRSPWVWAPALAMALLTGYVLSVGMAPALARLPFIVAPIVLAVLGRRAWLSVAMTLLLMTMTFIDLAQMNRNRFPHPYFDSQARYAAPRDALAGADAGRVSLDNTPRTWANLGLLTGTAVVGGDGFAPRRYAVYAARADAGPGNLPPLSGLLAADTVLTVDKHSGAVRARPHEAPRPRVYWCGHWRVAPDNAAALALLAAAGEEGEEGGGLATTCIVTGVPPPEMAEPAQAAPPERAAVRIVGESAAHVAIEVNAAAEGVVVLADTFAEGWSAMVDGEPAPVFPVNGLVRGVYIEPGLHAISFRYRIPGWRTGGVITAVTLIGLAAGSVLMHLRRQR